MYARIMWRCEHTEVDFSSQTLLCVLVKSRTHSIIVVSAHPFYKWDSRYDNVCYLLDNVYSLSTFFFISIVIDLISIFCRLIPMNHVVSMHWYQLPKYIWSVIQTFAQYFPIYNPNSWWWGLVEISQQEVLFIIFFMSHYHDQITIQFCLIGNT